MRMTIWFSLLDRDFLVTADASIGFWYNYNGGRIHLISSMKELWLLSLQMEMTLTCKETMSLRQVSS